MDIQVDYSEHFTSLLEGLTEDEQEIIGNLTLHVELKGFTYLPGKNKNSNSFSSNFMGPKRKEAEEFAVHNHLWHYHVGYEEYRKTSNYGSWTSEYVVHYQRLSEKNIRFVHYSGHNPSFRNPTPSHLI